MTTYILRRLIQGFVVLFLSTFMIYSILILTPGGPRDQINEMRISAAQGKAFNPLLIEYYEELYGLDKEYPLNYLVWLFDPEDVVETTYDLQGNVYTATKGINLFGIIKGNGVLAGDLGKSVNIDQGRSVADLMGRRIGNTLTLMGLALLVSVMIAVPIGITSAVKQYSKLDYAVTTFSFVGLSMPTFWLGLMLIILRAIPPRQWHNQGLTWMPYLPSGDTGSGGILNRLYHLVLPVTVLSFVSVAGLSRYVRASMLEVLRQDYVRTAWAKGLAQRVVILKHALRNALIPVITILTLELPGLFGGAIITETVFNYFGMGKLYFQSVIQLDIPLVMGFLLINVTLIIIANILADMLYATADPRIRFS